MNDKLYMCFYCFMSIESQKKIDRHLIECPRIKTQINRRRRTKLHYMHYIEIMREMLNKCHGVLSYCCGASEGESAAS